MIKRIDINLTKEQWELATKMFKSYNEYNKGTVSEKSESPTNIIMHLIHSALVNEQFKEKYKSPINKEKVHNSRSAGRKCLVTYEQVKALRDTGMTHPQIANELNVSVATVKRTLRPMLRFKKLKKQ